MNTLLSKIYIGLGHLALLALLFLSVWFAEERVLLVDSAYQLFYDINHESILINDHRFSMVLSQLVPWLLIKLHIPLRWLIVAYSASFTAIAYGCFIVAAHILHNWKTAALMVFSILAMQSTFFHCISETFQLMFFAPLLYALICHEQRGAAYWPALVVTAAATFFIHPVAIFFFLYIILFRLIDRHRIDLPLLVAAVLLIVFLAIKMLVGQSGHDSSFMPTSESLTYALEHFFHLNSFGFFRIYFSHYYLFPFLLWVITLIGYLRQRNWLKMAFVGLFALGFFALSVIVYWQGDGPIGMERTFLPLLFFVGLAFFEDELPRLHKVSQGICLIAFAALLIVSVSRIGVSTRPYVNRLAEIGHIARQEREQGQHKLIVTRSTAESVFPINIWGLAIESMLYTARDGADQTVTIYMEENDFDRTDSNLYQNPDVFVSVNWWKSWQVGELNPHYFHLPPQGYMELVKTEKGYETVPL